MVQVLEPKLELEPELELEPVQVAVLLQPLVLAHAQALAQKQEQEQEQEQEQASALETMAAPLRRASACLGHRPPEAQRPGDDQTLRHRPDQRPRSRT